MKTITIDNKKVKAGKPCNYYPDCKVIATVTGDTIKELFEYLNPYLNSSYSFHYWIDKTFVSKRTYHVVRILKPIK